MLQRGRSRSPKKVKHHAGDDVVDGVVEGVGPLRGRDLFVSIRTSADAAPVTFHAHSVVLLKYFQAGAFRDHLAFAEECDGAGANMVELVGDSPHAWRTLLGLLYQHFDLLYDEANRCDTSFDELALNLLEGHKSKVTTDLFELCLLTHKHGCEIFRAIIEKRFSRSFYGEEMDSRRWMKFWNPASAGVLLRCGMRDAVESWFHYESEFGEPDDIPCIRITNFLKQCADDELRSIALAGAKQILENMKEEETRKGHAEADSESDDQYELHGFRQYWDTCFFRKRGYSNNTVAKIEQMLGVIMETCKACPGCANAIKELSEVMPECLDTSNWDDFVSEQDL